MFSEFKFVADILKRTEAFGANEEVEQPKHMWSCLDIVVLCGLLKECNYRECSSEDLVFVLKSNIYKAFIFLAAREREEGLFLMS